MLRVNLNKLLNLHLRLDHNHSGEFDDYFWKVIDWNENNGKYDYKVSFTLKSNGRSVGTQMFYGMNSNGRLLKASVNWIIHHFISRGKRPPRQDFSTTLLELHSKSL